MKHILPMGLAAAFLMAAADKPGGGASSTATEHLLSKMKKPFEDEILGALAKLKHDVNDDWNDDGKPSMKRIVALAGNNEIKREHVEAVAPDLRRDVPAGNAAAAKLDPAKVDAEAPDELKNAKVRALRQGFYGGKLRYPGEDFTYTGKKPSWVVVLKD